VSAPEALDREALLAACERPPDAVVIDLARAPHTGRDLALWLRSRKATRAVPLVLAGGDDAFAVTLRELLPGATFANREDVVRALRAALGSAPAKPPPRPASALAGYSGTPLPGKLGIREGARVVLLGAPDAFAHALTPLPDGSRAVRRGPGEVVLLFVRSRAELARRLGAARRAVAAGGRLWIAWRKKASGVATDLGEAGVRQTGLAAGLVDYKVCAIDATWSGLCFSDRAAAARGSTGRAGRPSPRPAPARPRSRRR
jgi:hypothetical protein